MELDTNFLNTNPDNLKGWHHFYNTNTTNIDMEKVASSPDLPRALVGIATEIAKTPECERTEKTYSDAWAKELKMVFDVIRRVWDYEMNQRILNEPTHCSYENNEDDNSEGGDCESGGAS